MTGINCRGRSDNRARFGGQQQGNSGLTACLRKEDWPEAGEICRVGRSDGGLGEDDLIIVRFSRSDQSTVVGSRPAASLSRAQGW